VVVRHVPEPAAQLLLIQKGDADIARDLTTDQIATLANSKDIKVESFPGANSWYMSMNVTDERLAKPKVREALKLLVDYKGMTDTLLKGRFIVHQTFLPAGFPGAIDYNPFKLDVAKAKALLAEAGYPNGFEMKLDAPNFQPFTDIAQSIQQTMGQGGVKLNIVSAELKSVLTVYRASKHELLLVNWGPDYFDPHTNADAFANKPLAARNKWNAPEIAGEAAEAAKEIDTAKRIKLYADLQHKITDDGPFILMFQNTNPVARRVNVHGFTPGLTEDLNFYSPVTK